MMFRTTAVMLALCVHLPSIEAGEIFVNLESGRRVYTAQQDSTVVKFVPEAGANVYSIQVDDVEYLRQPESLDLLPGVGYGNPVLYPTPNRVRDGSFVFDGKTVQFKSNSGTNFIHGLVNRHAWEHVSSSTDALSASITCKADFREGTSLHSSFPFPHQLFLTITVTKDTVRWTYKVDNTGSHTAVPFGFALHPYFVYQGSRDQTFLKIPASHWMKADKQLPSGELVPADKLEYPLGEFMSLQGTTFDDVFWGIQPATPTVIEFRDLNQRVKILASSAFTHLVVWTPDRPYFGIESQTCSTDAHNLHAAGKTEAAHLQICPPGESMSGWVEYQFGVK